MHKNSIFFYISPSFIGAGAPCPPIGQWRPIYRHKRRDYDILVSLCLSFSFPFSFSFLSFPFLPSFFFAEEGGGGPGPPWIRAWKYHIIGLVAPAISPNKTRYRRQSWVISALYPCHQLDSCNCISQYRLPQMEAQGPHHVALQSI